MNVAIITNDTNGIKTYMVAKQYKDKGYIVSTNTKLTSNYRTWADKIVYVKED